MLDWARKYISKGWKVFPLHSIQDGICTCGNTSCSDAGKHPRIQNGAKGASRDPKKIEEWFGPKAPPSNIGIVTGEVSGITVIDIDCGPGKVGMETWAELTSEHGEPVTLISQTGSGGLHVVFFYNSALKTSSNVLGDNIDCRNDGGYIVAPPSLHKSGGRYNWQNWDCELAHFPSAFIIVINRKRKKKKKQRNKHLTIEQVADMLKFIDAGDRNLWRNIGVILGRAFMRSEQAWAVYVEWADSWKGKKGRGHDQIMHQAFYEISQQIPIEGAELGTGSLIHMAIEGGWQPKTGQVPIDQFLYFAPGNNFIYRPTCTFWPAESVDATCSAVNVEGELMKPSVWLKGNKIITSMTTDPLVDSEVLVNYDCRDGVMIETEGAAIYNAYRPPNLEPGDARLAKPFVEHVQRVFNKNGDADQFFNYMAHRVQNPGIKPRFSLLIAGEQGVGKDTAISMCYPAIGTWNVSNIDPAALDQAFNEYASKVLIVISEAANSHDMSRWAFNERTKVLIAGTPDFQTINPKYGHKFSVRLHCGVIITTNHMVTGIYIPPDDRRYDVIDSATKEELGMTDDQRADYFERLWEWFVEGGDSHVMAFLMERDLTGFSPSTGQRKTAAHKQIIAAGCVGDEWLGDALDKLKNPPLVRLDDLFEAVDSVAPGEFKRKEFNAKVAYALTRAGYTRLISHSSDGRWRTEDNKSVQIYRLSTLDIGSAVSKTQELLKFGKSF